MPVAREKHVTARCDRIANLSDAQGDANVEICINYFYLLARNIYPQ